MDKLENWGSKYALVTLAARRAKQLKSGAPPLIDTDSRNPLTVALEEIAAGKVTCVVSDEDLVISSAIEPEVAELLAIPQEPEEEPEVTVEETPAAHAEAATAFEEEEAEGEEEEEHHDEWEVGLGEEVEEEVEEEETPLVDEEEIAIPLAVDANLEELAVVADEEEAPKPAKKRKRGESGDPGTGPESADLDASAGETSEEDD